MNQNKKSHFLYNGLPHQPSCWWGGFFLYFQPKIFGNLDYYYYFCSMVENEMKREMGKWLMDVAKYMFTALLISTIFADMEEPVIIYCAVFAAFILLFWGWALFGSSFENNKKKEQTMNTIIISGSLALFATIVGLYYMYQDKQERKKGLNYK